MALSNTDVFIVQRQTGSKDHYKTSLLDLVNHVTAQPVLTYRGLINLTAEPTGQLDPNPPQTGDVYLNSTAGVLASGYTGLSAGDPVSVDDRLVFNGTEWQHIPQPTFEGVASVSSTAPITVNDSDKANPVIGLSEIDGGIYAS